MAYANIDFKTKKELREYIKTGKEVEVYSPGPFPVKTEGRITIEGPHYPKPHSWYALVEVKNGIITKFIR